MPRPESTPTPAAKRQLTCPRCAVPSLEACTYEGKEVAICTRCRGLWCEPWDWDVEGLGEAPVVGPFLERAPDIVAAGPSKLACPECATPLTILNVREVENLEIDQCDRCGGVWFDHREWAYLEALRSWQSQRESSERPTTWSEWFFQLVLWLPVEFNVPPRRFPLATFSIILLCFCIHLLGGASRFADFGISAADFDSSRYLLTAFTHQFIHGGWPHLIANLYFLYILGDNIEDVLGPLRHFLLFLACGVIAAAVYLLLTPGGSPSMPLVGASGAIAGIMSAYLLLFPSARLTFMLIVFQFKLPVWAWMAIWLAFQVAGLLRDAGGHVGWLAHVGGFAAGFLLVWPFRARLVERHALLHLLHTRRL